jgi:hypothetical protein
MSRAGYRVGSMPWLGDPAPIDRGETQRRSRFYCCGWDEAARACANISAKLALSNTSGRSLDESLGHERHRQPQLDGPRQVGGDAAPQGLLDLWPGAPRRDRPANPPRDDRAQRLDWPPRPLGLPGKGPLPLAARGAPPQATRWSSRDGGKNAREAQVFPPPAVVGLRIIACLGQPAREGPSGQRVCHQWAKFHLVPARSPVRDLSTQAQGGGPPRHRPLQPGPGPVACAGPRLVVGAGWRTRKTRGIHGHRAGPGGHRARQPAAGCGQHTPPQAWVDLVAAAPPPRGGCGRRSQPQRLLELLGTDQQRLRPTRVQVQICLHAQTGQPRWWRLALRGKCAGVVAHLGACALDRQACQAHSIMALPGASPPQPSLVAGERRFSTEQR